MNGLTVALETYAIAAVISGVVAGLILFIRNVVARDKTKRR